MRGIHLTQDSSQTWELWTLPCINVFALASSSKKTPNITPSWFWCFDKILLASMKPQKLWFRNHQLSYDFAGFMAPPCLGRAMLSGVACVMVLCSIPHTQDGAMRWCAGAWAVFPWQINGATFRCRRKIIWANWKMGNTNWGGGMSQNSWPIYSMKFVKVRFQIKSLRWSQ